MKKSLLAVTLLASVCTYAQNTQQSHVMTPELLWSLKHVNGDGLSSDGQYLYFSSRKIDWHTETSTIQNYKLRINTGKAEKNKLPEGKAIIERGKNAWYATDDKTLYKSTDEGASWSAIYSGLENAENVWVSPDGNYVAFSKDVLVKPMLGTDIYSDLPKTTAKVYTDLAYRHWDNWEDGKFSHIFVASLNNSSPAKDIMQGQAYDSPQKPFGGTEDLVWLHNGKGLVYVCKKAFGKEYAQSTNTDLYYYDIATGNTTDWTKGMMGYDNQPAISKDGNNIAWVSMARDGYEADKVCLYVMGVNKQGIKKINLTKDWDETVNGFKWSENGKKIFFTAPWHGTEQLFEVNVPNDEMAAQSEVKQITTGNFDINDIIGQSGNRLIVSRTDMNHAAEIYNIDLSDGSMYALTHQNDSVYNSIKLSKTVLRKVKTTDGKEMGVWVIYPPNFNPAKKYPTLLYCQGGPQSALSQFYSFRWNFQLMAANGYIIVAPNRRGMPGWGTQWNEEISKDWGGQPMQDYLSAIDDVSKESYVDKNRLGCVGASYGGYSVYMLAGMHENRFKTFIAHDGLFDLKSWYGTTEELWFANWDIGGNYWQKPAVESYEKYNPSNFVDKWNKPIMIVQGGIDYRVPIEQGLEAFGAAQQKGLKSKLLFLPNENHWVLHPQNGMAWQREFFKWLDETLK